MSLPDQLCINPNPDIAGIGVRVSIYTQAFLTFVPALFFFRDGTITDYESGTLRATFINTLLTACALLLSAFIQIKTYGLSVYHTIIVLNLSWINNANAVACIILVKTEMDRKRARDQLRGLAPKLPDEETRLGWLGLRSETGRPHWPAILAVAHLCVMASLGIWLWSNVRVFGPWDQLDCTPQTFMTVLGYDLLVILMNIRLFHFFVDFNVMLLSILYFAITKLLVGANLIRPILDEEKQKKTARYEFHLLVAAIIVILFMVDTEAMIRRSANMVKSGESQWTFGQTLAMFMVVIPLSDCLKQGYEAYKRKKKTKAMRIPWPVWNKDFRGGNVNGGMV